MISVFMVYKEKNLTSYMCKSTKWSSWTVSILPNVVAFGGFVDLGGQTKGQRFKPGKVDTVSCCRRQRASPLGETAVQCASDNTGSCLRCHTLMVRPTRHRVSHSDKVSTCSHGHNPVATTQMTET